MWDFIPGQEVVLANGSHVLVVRLSPSDVFWGIYVDGCHSDEGMIAFDYWEVTSVERED
jgi:hypothetical protein